MAQQYSSIAEVEAALAPFMEVAVRTVGKNLTIARSQRLMAHIGNPEQRLRVVHVAGTSGKTSTTYYIATLLQAAGVHVGYTVSPHVDSICERVQLDGRPLSEQRFCRLMSEFLTLIANVPEMPSWFEVLTAFAFWVFDREGVDYAVVETGLGGLQDTTNVARRADKLCVLTDIGMDHMQILGDTLAAIAYQKVGIVHDSNQVLMYEQPPEVMQVVRYWVSQQEDAELFTFTQSRLAAACPVPLSSAMPLYQQRNWLLAFAAYSFVARRDSLRQLNATQLSATTAVQVPGRMDELHLGGTCIIMDGAHNRQKMQALADSLAARYPGQRFPVLLALKEGKELADIAPLVAGFASGVVVTAFTVSQDLPQHARDPNEIAMVLQKMNVPYTVEPDTERAWRLFMADVKTTGVVTGSFYLLSQLRKGLTRTA